MRRLAILVALVGCGDQAPDRHGLDVTSGTRLKAQWTFYGDGSREPELGGMFYDAELHAACSVGLWGDGLQRCVPDASGEALFTTADCTELVGASDIEAPKFFILREIAHAAVVQSHIYYAGTQTTRPSGVYRRVDGQCTGPQAAPSDTTYFTVGSEAGVAAVADNELVIDDERISLFVRESDDGLVIPRGQFDRTLERSCSPARRPEGIVCAPEIPRTFKYRDAACTQPLYLARAGETPPLVAPYAAFDACPQYVALGALYTGPIYEDFGGLCAEEAIDPGERAFSLDEPGSVQALERHVENRPGVRLQRITLAAGPVRFYDPRMFDTTLQVECVGQQFDDVVRCVPALSASSVTAYTAGCVDRVRVAQRSTTACEQPSYLRDVSTDDGTMFYPLGDAITAPLYQLDKDGCVPVAMPANIELRALGEPVPLTGFVGGHVAAER